MDCNTGELLRVFEGQPGFTEVPDTFKEEVEIELGDKERAFVDMGKDTPLVNWAKSKQNPPHPDGNRKHRRKMAKGSRKRNRG